MSIFFETLEQLEDYWIYIMIIATMCMLFILYKFIKFKLRKRKEKKFFKKHPEAAKIYVMKKSFFTKEIVEIHAIDNQAPVHFKEKREKGVLVIPGVRTLEVSYTYSRPGLRYHAVTRSTDIIEKEIEVEKNKSYLLGFDRKIEQFYFDEIE